MYYVIDTSPHPESLWYNLPSMLRYDVAWDDSNYNQHIVAAFCTQADADSFCASLNARVEGMEEKPRA